jgi:sterol desaturase/sphingolipid hydroxylase (fatty acid hydroxylase superfamily)
LIWSGVFASHLIRCVLASGLTELAVNRVPALRARRLRSVEPDDAQRRREFRSTLHTGAIFAFQFLILVGAAQAGWTQLYFDPRKFGAGYLVLSFVLALLIQDTYFYWTHRWMHRRAVFKTVHLDHHRSRCPTAWTAFSLHPLEAVVQGGIHLLLPLIIPLHVSVFGAFIVFTNVYGALLHCGCDVFFVSGVPASSWRARWLNGAIEHEAHHNGCEGNFALYFSFWDRLIGTRRIPAHTASLHTRVAPSEVQHDQCTS